MFFVWTTLLICFVVTGIDTIFLEVISVPEVVFAGQDVFLNCRYNMEGDKMYRLNWSKNKVDFYRYLPGTSSPYKAYNNRTLGTTVDTARSSFGNVVLKNVTLNSTGRYTCVVYSDEPFFNRKETSRNMTVYVLPMRRPQIKGKRDSYELSETVNLTCVSSPSSPTAKLTWWINGVEANSRFLHSKSTGSVPGGLKYSTLAIRFSMRKHFLNGSGKMQVTCNALVGKYYNSSVSVRLSHNISLSRIFAMDDHGQSDSVRKRNGFGNDDDPMKWKTSTGTKESKTNRLTDFKKKNSTSGSDVASPKIISSVPILLILPLISVNLHFK